jgi:hypothetical protein
MFITTVVRLDSSVSTVTGLPAESRRFFFFLALRPNAGCGLHIHDVSRSHTTTHHSWYTPLDEWSARHTDLYLTTQNNYNRHPCPPAWFEPTISAGKRLLGPAITEEYWWDCRQCIPHRVGIFQVVLCVLNDLLCTGLKTKSISCRKFCRKFPDVKCSCLPKQPSRGIGSVLCKNKPWERNILRDIIWNKVIYFEWDIFRELLYHILGGKKRLILFV